MTSDLKRLVLLKKYIERKIIGYGILRDKERYVKWCKRHAQILKTLDKLKFKELKQST